MTRPVQGHAATTAARFGHLLAALPGNPEIIPHELDLLADRVLLTRIPLADQSAASFLDQRVLKPGTEGAWFPWHQFKTAAMGTAADAPAYILHLGHCGSTLLSRLVEAAAGGRPIREPLPLRALAFEAADAVGGVAFLTDSERRARLSLLERLWARGGNTVVKATSICNDLADELDARSPAAFVYIGAQAYITALLGGANSYADLRGFAQLRMRRFKARFGWTGALSALRAGELAALCWLTEAAAISAAARPIHLVDFEKFLAEPAAELALLCRSLGFAPDASAVERAVTGPIMDRYAKAPEYAYDASARQQILAEAGQRHAAEIRAGMNWLERTGRDFSDAAAVLQHFGAVRRSSPRPGGHAG